MPDCIFCQIASKQLSAHITYEDKQVIAFNDIDPQAPVHQLIIPKQHISTLNDITSESIPLIGHMVKVASELAHEFNLNESGYRTVFNCNANGGQMVFHIHLHLLGGRQMSWPPG